MSTMIPSFLSRPLALGAALAMSCNGGGSEQAKSEAPPVTAEAGAPEMLPTAIHVDLPKGIEVSLNGRARGVTPLAAMEVEPGTYTVTLAAGCKTMHLPLDVRAHETKKVDLASAVELGLVPLEIVAKDKSGEPLEHTVSLDDEVLGGGKGASTTLVPPCKARLKVASEGLGGFIEDIDFGKVKGESMREIVLAPGPDMVRIHGGAFTLGPTERYRKQWSDELGALLFTRVPFDVETFDLDRTEVTASQWHECRASANPLRCYSESECEGAIGCPDRVYLVTHLPDQQDRTLCNADPVAVDRSVRQGREAHPMNCVARWEAEDYCRWVGKRLPNTPEWEYAARSGDDDREWPWGHEPPACARGQFDMVFDCMGPSCDRGLFLRPDLEPNPDYICNIDRGTAKTCSRPEGHSDQGVCDLVGNVTEYVQPTDLPNRYYRPEDDTCRGPGWRHWLGDRGVAPFNVFHGRPCSDHEPARQEADVGFRCARSVLTTEQDQ